MRTKAIGLALAIVLLRPFAPAQWVQTNGPCGGTVNCLLASGTSLFAGTDAGVFRSTNSIS